MLLLLLLLPFAVSPVWCVKTDALLLDEVHMGPDVLLSWSSDSHAA